MLFNFYLDTKMDRLYGGFFWLESDNIAYGNAEFVIYFFHHN